MAEDLKTEIKGRVLQVKDLPTLPAVLDEVTKLVESPDSSGEDIAKAISKDQVLSAKVLKMVNSPIYGFPGRIGSIQHALVLLGFNVIRGIIISTSVFDYMTATMKGLWEHSIGCATACGALARQLKLKDPEEYSVGGLLHDLGKVVAAVQLPDILKDIEAMVKEKDILYLEAEKRVMGFGHDRINAWLAGHWRLPPNIKEGMSRHHNPEAADLYPEMAAIIHVGDFLVRVFEYGSSGDDQLPTLSKKALAVLKVTMADLEATMDFLSEQFMEISDLDLS
jgi:putative nucleotidyltransferase with HDIG domain